MSAVAAGVRRTRTALVAVVLAALVLLGAPGASVAAVRAAPTPGVAAAEAAAATRLQARVAQVSPAVATPGQDVKVSVDVVNPTGSTASSARVALRVGSAGALRTREQIRTFAASGGRDDPVVVDAPVTGSLGPRETARVDLTVPSRALQLSGAYGTLPMTIDVAGSGADTARTTTFLPYQVRKEYQPLSMALAVPLTLDPDPALVVGAGQDRGQAWAKAVGPTSRLARVVAATTGRPIAWAVDPGVVGGDDPAAKGSAGSRSSDDTVVRAQDEFAERLSAAARGRDVWALPPQDPDLVELTGSDAGTQMLGRAAGAHTRLAEALGTSAVPRLAWPVGGPLSVSGLEAVVAAYGQDGPGAVLTPGSSLDPDAQNTGPALRQLPSGTPVLGYDSELSRLFAQVTGSPSVATAISAAGPVPRPATAAEGSQRFLAESLALLNQSPGVSRNVLVAAPRDLDPDAASVGTFMSSLAAAPWITTTSPRAMAAARTPTTPMVRWTSEALDPLSPGASPIDGTDLTTIGDAARSTAGLAQVLPAATAGSSAFLPDSTTLRALLSARWRHRPGTYTAAARTVETRVETLTNGVSVVPSTVNFFADHGILQITVVNDLDVEVHDVRLVVQPQGRPSRLRVTSPPSPLRISPHSRTTVRLQVEAVAAGVVPIATHVETPAGTRLGTDAPVRVRVQPTNGWLILALGGLVGVVFLAGLYRALRGGSPRVSSEDLKEIDLE